MNKSLMNVFIIYQGKHRGNDSHWLKDAW